MGHDRISSVALRIRLIPVECLMIVDDCRCRVVPMDHLVGISSRVSQPCCLSVKFLLNRRHCRPCRPGRTSSVLPKMFAVMHRVCRVEAFVVVVADCLRITPSHHAEPCTKTTKQQPQKTKTPSRRLKGNG